jgi:hypothetical protein
VNGQIFRIVERRVYRERAAIMGKTPFWNLAIEFIKRAALERLQLARLRKTSERTLRMPSHRQRLN